MERALLELEGEEGMGVNDADKVGVVGWDVLEGKRCVLTMGSWFCFT